MGNIYSDMAARTGGDIYIGVVGPVRTGKSTFIKRFMESLVIPNIRDAGDKARTVDELPQAAAGKTVMTTEPKFIPANAVKVDIGEGASFRVKMIDCVGYTVSGALGNLEDGEVRMVNTPWSDEPMEFEKAAELGTHKVITEHSTVAVVVTTDGSIGEIGREGYLEAEARVISELKALGKPFAVILNTLDPCAVSVGEIRAQMEKEYGVPVIPASCMRLTAEDIAEIMRTVLFAFPIKEVRLKFPPWINSLEKGHWLRSAVYEAVLECAEKISKVGDVKDAFAGIGAHEFVGAATLEETDLGSGRATVAVTIEDGLLYKVISESCGCDVKSETELIELLGELTEMKKEYVKIKEALERVRETGYGIVTPDVEDLKLEEPEIVRQAGGYGVKLRASAPSIHMISAQIQTEVSPIVGTEKQSEELVKYLLKEFEEDPKRIWESNIFGKNLHELVNEGLHTKLEHLPAESRAKLKDTLERLINEGSGGLICIIL